LLLLDGQPEGKAPTARLLCVGGECAEGGKLFERSIEAFAIDVAIEKTADLIPVEAVGSGFDGLANAVGDGISPSGHQEYVLSASSLFTNSSVGCWIKIPRGICGGQGRSKIT
jgi:hypothetical protein